MPEDKSPSPLPPPWDRIFGLGTRLFVWGLIAAIIYVLQPFFLLLFLTFVFAYIQAHGVDGLVHRIGKRWVRAVVVFVVFLGTLVAIGWFLVPHIERQVQSIAEKYTDWIKEADKNIRAFAERNHVADRLPTDFSVGKVIADLLGLFGDEQEGGKVVTNTITFMKGAAGWIFAIGSAFLLSLLFSFLIVLDLPKLTRGVRGLAHTKVGFIYAEVADSIYGFCRIVGRAMEAQMVIALCNTVLTAIGLWLIGIGEGNLVFLCTIVFLFSFVPVAGVFVSSTPICIAALTQVDGGGIGLMLLAVVIITIIHMIEAYVLNPQIYGHHLRMNPVLTLIILVLCGKLFGPWGLILGIPVVNYVFTEAIRFQQPQAVEGSTGVAREQGRGKESA